MSTSRELEMISAYLDGEVPKPYSDKMAQFIEAAPHRVEARRRYESVRTSLQSLPEGDLEGAQERVWSRLQQRLQPERPSVLRLHSEPWWRRAVNVPLPAAAAAVVLFFGVALVLLRTPAGQQGLPEFQSRPEAMSVSAADFGLVNQPDFGFRSTPTVGRDIRIGADNPRNAGTQFGSDLQLRVQLDSFAQLLEILASQNLVRDITINLPQDSQFGIHGEPALMRASEISAWGAR